MKNLYERTISYFVGFGVIYSLVAVISRDFQWALDNALNIAIVSLISAAFCGVFSLFDGGY